MKKKQNVVFEVVGYQNEALFSFMHNNSTDDYPSHWHNAVEIIMPLENSYKVVTPECKYDLNEYDILIVPPGEQHEMFSPKSKGQRIILQFDLAALNSVRGFINASYIYAKYELITALTEPELHDTIKNLLLEMLEENSAKRLYYEVSIINKIIGITVDMARRQQVEDSTEYENFNKRKEYVAKFNYCIDYINNNYKDNLTLDSVSRAVDFSKYHFARWFRQFSNMSFNDYLTKVRIDKAETMLLSTSMPVTEVAMEAGFQSIPTFNRIFKKYKKCTPTEYRNFFYLNANNGISADTPITGGVDTPDIHRKNSIMINPNSADLQDIKPCKCGAPRINPDGTFTNPFLWTDIPDPDVIRVGDVYYMSSTTMHFSPGCPIMKSYDLINWEIVNYAYDILEDSDSPALRNGAYAYGKGSWASSLRYHNGTFYVVVGSFTTDKTYIFQTEDIENGPWRRYTLNRMCHDMSLLFDDDGRVYLIYGGGTIHILELNADVTGIKEGGLEGIIIEKANVGGDNGLPAEGSHFYKINGKYYIFLISWPRTGSGRRIELCYRADCVEGPYEGKVVLDDDLGFYNMGVAQGGIFDALCNTPGTPVQIKWYAMLFQDHFSVGRIPVLVPVAWEDGWPVFGVDGKVPEQMALPVISGVKNIVISDEFYQGTKKDFAAVNDISYRYGHMGTDGCFSDGLSSDEELIINGNFNEGIQHWGNTDIAKIKLFNDGYESDTNVLFVSDRATTASGPSQDITGKVKPGGVYEVCAYVKYVSGLAAKNFNICIRNGSSWEGISIMGSGYIKRGEWGVLRGTYTLPADADISETTVFIETPWVDRPKKETDLMDFYVKSISVIAKPMSQIVKTMAGENDLNGSNLALAWQWNHNPDNNLWSLTERAGFLRLKTGYLCQDIIEARNTLTQRTFGPECSGSVAVELGGMKDGDVTGLAAFQDHYGYVGVKMVNNVKYIVMVNAASGGQAQEIESIPLTRERIYLKVDFDFKEKTDKAYFYYSLDEIHWNSIGNVLPMEYRLSHFVGYRFALFYYATQITGGFVDFDYFRVYDCISRNDDSVNVLKAAFGEDLEVPGVSCANVEIPITMDALPEGSYKGIYLSLALSEELDILNVVFCNGNISGNTEYNLKDRQLVLSVTGDSVAFTNKTSDLFAILQLQVNGFAVKDTSLILRPDYIYVDGGNAVYNIHDMRVKIKLTAPVTKAKAKIPGCANPLISYKYGADPWALEYDGRIYVYLTGDKYEYNDNGRLRENTYGKINTVSVISSEDMLNWTDHGEITVAGSKWAVCAWSPTVAVKAVDGKDKFFLYFASGDSGIGVLTADSPIGPWVDSIGEPLINLNLPGIKNAEFFSNPAVFIDSDGLAYLYFGVSMQLNKLNRNSDNQDFMKVYAVKLSCDMMSIDGEAVEINAPGFLGSTCINKYNGKYYFSYCSNYSDGDLPVDENENKTGNEFNGDIIYMTGDNPYGPFTNAGTVLKNPSHFFNTEENSHHCIFTFKDAWYIAYHTQTLGKALDKVKGYRSPHINKLKFYANGQICPVTPDMTGVWLNTSLNPYKQTSAATIAWCAGLSTVGSDENCMCVTEIHDGDWLAVVNADFGKTGADKFTACVASVVGGEIEIRLDSLLGENVGTLGVGHTGSEDIWELRTCEVKRITGTHNLFFIFNGDSERNLFNFNYWFFS